MKISISRFSSEIVNHNTDRMCVQETCAKTQTSFYDVEIGDLTFYLPVCDEHSETICQIFRKMENSQNNNL